MAGKGNNAEPAAEKVKVPVLFGLLKRKVKDGTGAIKEVERHSYVRVRKSTATGLGLTAASESQLSREVTGGRIFHDYGSEHGKKILVPFPDGAKTAKGKIRTYEIVVPSDAKISEISKFLQGSTAKQFKIKGGRTYSVS